MPSVALESPSLVPLSVSNVLIRPLPKSRNATLNRIERMGLITDRKAMRSS
jgi:hypothetical protein